MNYKPLEDYEFRILHEILEALDTGVSIMDPSELDGLLTAVISLPNQITDPELFAIIWNNQRDDDRQPNWGSSLERKYFESLVKRQRKYLLQVLRHQPNSFVPMVYFSETTEDGPEISLDDWSSGYVMGIDLIEETESLSDEDSQFIESTLEIVDYDELSVDDENPEVFAEACYQLRESVLEIYNYFHGIIKQPVQSESAADSTPRRPKTSKPILTLVK